MSDTFNAGEIERESNEANRKRFHQQRLEAKQRKMEPVLRKVKKPSKEPSLTFDPESPEGILLAEVKARLACRDDRCRSESLQRIRRHAETLLPVLPKLMSGQDNKVITEVLRLAGLFKARGAVDAVSRALLLSDKAVCHEAVWTIGAIGSARGIPALKRYASLEHPPKVMASICRSFGQIAAQSGLAPIEAVFLQGTTETRLECLNAAARVGGDKARAFIERSSADPRSEVAEAAHKILKAMPKSSSEESVSIPVKTK